MTAKMYNNGTKAVTSVDTTTDIYEIYETVTTIYHAPTLPNKLSTNTISTATASTSTSTNTITTDLANNEKTTTKYTPVFKSTNITIQRCGASVQNLRNLWNQRIMEQQQQQQQQKLQQDKPHQQQYHVEKRTQSISCLNSMNYGTMQYGARAQSLHDCTQIELVNALLNRDRLQREKDNFYKYKTAEQAARHIPMRFMAPRFTVSGTNEEEDDNNTISHTPTNTPTPTINIHPDPFDQAVTTATTTSTALSEVMHSTDITINDDSSLPPLPQKRNLKSPTSQTIEQDLNTTDTQMTQAKSNSEATPPLHWLRGTRRASIINSTSTGEQSPSSNTKSYPLGGKMSKDCASASGSNIVAQLTQELNDIIRNNKKLLGDVKRKNGVLMARGGHDYKVLENTERNEANALKRNNSNVSSPRASSVQRQKERFEVKEEPQKSPDDAPESNEALNELHSKDLLAVKTTDVEHNLVGNAKNKDRKQKYAKIYEKFRIRSPFKQSENNNDNNDIKIAERISECGEEKILTALQVVDQKLKGLTANQCKESSLKDFEPLVQPNSSFVHQSKAQLGVNLTQAVNVALVNSITTAGQCNMNDSQSEESIYEPIDEVKNIMENDTTLYHTNDELPELPKPMPIKRHQTPKLPLKQSHLIQRLHSFYDDKDNMYSTIQSGQHCHESLHVDSMSNVAKCTGESVIEVFHSITLISNGYINSQRP